MWKRRCNTVNIWTSRQSTWRTKVPIGILRGPLPRWKKWCNPLRIGMKMPKHPNSLPGHKKGGDHRSLAGKNNTKVQTRIRLSCEKCPTWKPCSRISRATMAKTQRGNQKRICFLAPNPSLPYLSTQFPKETLRSKRRFSNSVIIEPYLKMTGVLVRERSRISGMTLRKRSRHRYTALSSKNCRRSIPHQEEKTTAHKTKC